MRLGRRAHIIRLIYLFERKGKKYRTEESLRIGGGEGCDTSGNLVRSGRNQLEIIGYQLEITEIWLEIRNQDPVEIRKSARNHKKSSRNNEKHPLFV